MKVLLHLCCAPCAIYPHSVLLREGFEATGFFFNPNIHPFQEFQRRLNTVEHYSASNNLQLICEKEYGLCDFLRRVAFHEDDRCLICYRLRIEKTAALAKDLGFDAFSTTLLYSKYQRHEILSDICRNLSVTYGVPFLYRDFRQGWREGIDRSIELNMYRQPYCGCIYSEQERYDKSLRKKKNK
jgi:predicted adenine nucleotide alpha hydrolase (AANH) superfamily ATPase